MIDLISGRLPGWRDLPIRRRAAFVTGSPFRISGGRVGRDLAPLRAAGARLLGVEPRRRLRDAGWDFRADRPVALATRFGRVLGRAPLAPEVFRDGLLVCAFFTMPKSI
jgi:hypothetical protein